MSFSITQVINKFLPVKIIGSAYKDIILQDEAIALGNGTPFAIESYKTLNIKIAGTSTGRTVSFEVAGFDGAYEPIQGVKTQDLSMATQTTGNNESWQFDVTGFVFFRARIDSITDGTVNVKGRAVA
ncbi:hypothetical protein [Priestia megaterium]|uniref:hypothetical protein n=1 Tax=Priestia megaterium TaxID=1404 RepID=UPI003CC66FB2